MTPEQSRTAWLIGACCLAATVWPARADENWTLVASEGGARYYFDPTSIRRDRQYLRFDARVEYAREIEREIASRDPAVGKKLVRYRERLSRIAASCDAKTWTESSFSLRDAAGKVAGSGSRPPGEWEKAMKEAPPSSTLDKLIEAACEKAPAPSAEAGPSAVAAPPASPPAASAAPKPPGAGERPQKAGTGVVIGSSGQVLTNHHVVAGCTTIGVIEPGQGVVRAVLLGSDRRNDLALLKAARALAKPARFRAEGPLRAGEPVVVAGFPLSGLLASEPNIAFGHVSATAGLANDSSTFQISAPIHKGNSGGPILDQYGRFVGVVTSKLNAAKTADLVGDLAQNIAFGVKAEVIGLFLDAQGTPHDASPRAARLEGADLAAAAKEPVVQVVCR